MVSWQKLMEPRSMHIHMSSCDASLAATYLALQEERVIIYCWQVDQVMTPVLSKKQWPLTDWHVLTHVAKSESMYPMRQAG